MIVSLTSRAFDALADGVAPSGLHFVQDSIIAPREVLRMLSDLNRAIEADFGPSAWMIVEGDEIVGLCSITKPPESGDVHIGYGIAPSCEGRGFATAAIGELLAWSRGDARVKQVSAETAVDNIGSQRVLERNGFVRSTERVDPEDGLLICWKITTG